MDFYETQNYSTVEERASEGKGDSVLETGGKALQAEIEAIKESIPWSAFGSFVSNVRKYGEGISQNARREIEEAKKDLKTIGETLHKDLIKVTSSEASASTSTGARDVSSTESASTTEHASTTDALGAWFKSTNLDKYAADIGRFIKDAVVIEEPEEADGRGGVLFDKNSARRQQVFLNRMERQLSELQNDVKRILDFAPPSLDASDGKAYADFVTDFSADDNTTEIAEQLERYPDLRTTMEELVPEKLEYKEFWQRYYWLVAKLKIEEERRKRLLDRAALEEEAPAWDDDDEEDVDSKENESVSTPAPKVVVSPVATKSTSTETLKQDSIAETDARKSTDRPASATTKSSPRASSDSSYDLVSQQQTPSRALSETTRTPPPGENDAASQRADTPKAASAVPSTTKTDDESDDDWE